jgi:hypothetical protein
LGKAKLTSRLPCSGRLGKSQAHKQVTLQQVDLGKKPSSQVGYPAASQLGPLETPDVPRVVPLDCSRLVVFFRHVFLYLETILTLEGDL